MLKKILPIVCITGAVIITSCGSNNNTNQDTQNKDTAQVQKDTTKTVSTSDKDYDNDTNQYMLPSPMQIAFIFKKAGLAYHSSLTNSADNAANYNTKYAQKLGFGIYSGDLAYCVLNNQNQAAINYIKTLGDISAKIWMTNIFENSTVLSRFKNNIGNQDSLISVISDMQKMMDSYIQENGISNNSTIIFSGAWIETMYIASNACKKENNPNLMVRLSEQNVVLDNILGLLNQQNKADTKTLRSKLTEIQKQLNNIDVQSQNNANIDQSQLGNLIKVIAAARKSIIAG